MSHTSTQECVTPQILQLYQSHGMIFGKIEINELMLWGVSSAVYPGQTSKAGSGT
jgi:hypothetical protein